MFGYCNLFKLTEEQEVKLREIDRKLDKSGHTPNRFLGTDANGNVVPRLAPSGDGTGLTTEQEQKLNEVDQKLDKTELPEAINRALVQARNSGLFDGEDGKTPHLSIGTVTTLEPGHSATAEITGTVENLKLNLGIPRGMDGGSGSGDISQAQLQQTVNQALMEAKNSGQFDGPAGADGGYYTPQVSQPDAEHLEFGFSPSTQGMAPVNPVQIPLPKAPGGGSDSGSTGFAPQVIFSRTIDTAGVKIVSEKFAPADGLYQMLIQSAGKVTTKGTMWGKIGTGDDFAGFKLIGYTTGVNNAYLCSNFVFGIKNRQLTTLSAKTSSAFREDFYNIYCFGNIPAADYVFIAGMELPVGTNLTLRKLA